MSEITEIWKKYERGRDHHHKMSIFNDTDKCWRFFEGDHWHGLERDGENLPIHNFIKPTIRFKTAMIAQNLMSINYSSMNTDNQVLMAEICQKLNKYASTIWELRKMDSKVWDIIKSAMVTGDAYIYFYDADLNCQQIDRKNIYLSDEQEPDIQRQKHVIIYERRFVDDVKKDAKANGIKDIDSIVPDEDTDNLSINGKNEVKTEDGKCSCLLELRKNKNGYISIRRSTKTVIYQEETEITGLTTYPIASLIIDKKYESARGNGEVLSLIPNQIETNKVLAWRLISTQLSAFPKPVYNREFISNPASIGKVGMAIEVDSPNVQDIKKAFDYVYPAQMSGDVKVLQDELLHTTRDLAGAGDAATGNINPEKASGAAIIAVRDQAAIPMNEHIANYQQFVEDVANIWFGMWIAYNPNGMNVTYEEQGETITETIPAEVLQELKIHTRIDVSSKNPFSKFAREQALENALAQQHITFEEYVEALDEDSTAPKAKFEMVLESRGQATPEQLMGIIEQQGQMLEMLQGGGANEMQPMPEPTANPELPL